MRRPTKLAATFLLLTGAARAACPGYSVCPVVNYPSDVARNRQVKASLAAILRKMALVASWRPITARWDVRK